MNAVVPKRLIVPLAAVLLLAALAAGSALAQAKGQAAHKASAMQSFLIVAPHTPDQCLAALDAMAANPALLAKFDWGCMAGDHTGYCIVQASSDKAALAMLPEAMRASAKAIALNKFTVEQIKSFHEKK